MSALATRQDDSVYLPRIMNTAAGFKLLVWRRGVLVHRCPRASRSGLYETVTLTPFAPSCFPPERSLGVSRNPSRNAYLQRPYQTRTGQCIRAPTNHRRYNQGAHKSPLHKEVFSIFDMLHLRESACITTSILI